MCVICRGCSVSCVECRISSYALGLRLGYFLTTVFYCLNAYLIRLLGGLRHTAHSEPQRRAVESVWRRKCHTAGVLNCAPSCLG